VGCFLAAGITLAGLSCGHIRPETISAVAGGDTRAISRTTAPNTHRGGLRFAVIGDFGDGSVIQASLARRMCKWRRRHLFNLVITTGDNIYPDGARRYFRRGFFRPYRCLLKQGVQWHASLGNHDYITRLGGPEVRTPAFGIKKRNYVVRKSGVRFLIANSNRMRIGWLRRKLAASVTHRWTIVVFHHPVVSPGPHGPTPGFRPTLPRLFSRTGVDLVLNGHDHLYSVSRKVRGVRYVVTGGGGGVLYACGRRRSTSNCVTRNHFLFVVAGRHKIRVRAVGIRGRPFARFATRARP
jgi:hypothetical protein